MRDASHAVAGGALTIGEAARRAGLTPKAVRLYEARGLLPPVSRTISGYRLYSGHDLRLLAFIRRARDIGLSLGEIRTIIELRRTGTPPSREVMGVLQARLAEVEERIGELNAVHAALADVLDTAASKAGSGVDPRLCQILEHGRSRDGGRGGGHARAPRQR